MHQFGRARQRMVEQLSERGITDARVLAAMGAIPRERFVEQSLAYQAYQDSPLPIGSKQTISQPYIVALSLQALALLPSDRVLEIGTGSGYQTAILSGLVAQVYSIERHIPLSLQARERLEAMQIRNVVIMNGDGTLGWREYAPYDAIIVSAFGPEVPNILYEQLSEGGRLIMPVGTDHHQELVKVIRLQAGATEVSLGAVRFVPLVGKFGWERPATGSR